MGGVDRAAEAWIRAHVEPAGAIETAHQRPWATVLRVPRAWLVALPLYAELQRGEAAHARDHLAHGVPTCGWRRCDRAPVRVAGGHLPVPRGAQPAGTGRPVVRAAPGCISGAVGWRPGRSVRPGDPRRHPRAHLRLGAAAGLPARGSAPRVRPVLCGHTASCGRPNPPTAPLPVSLLEPSASNGSAAEIAATL